MKQILFWLNKGTSYLCDNVWQPTLKPYYTTIKLNSQDTAETVLKRARNNLCKQLYKSTGVWWQFIHFEYSDMQFKILEEN